MSEEKSEFKVFEEKVKKEFKNAWENIEDRNIAFSFADEYKTFLDNSKTERLCANEIIKYAKENNYSNLEDIIKDGKSLLPGAKVYAENKGKSVIMAVIGKKNVSKGLNIVGSHIDSPRIDLKPNPLYEDSNLALMKTHYYGGIRKYQWATIPLSMHGVIITKDNKTVNVSFGEDESEPVFYISDLLPHLAKDQNKKTFAEGITGENLNLIVGSIPYGDKDTKEKIKLNVLRIFNEKYGIIEEDFLSAEIEIVPAGKARDVGFDKGLILGYGHDDRICTFSALKGLLEIANPVKTAMTVFVDKEEVGSQGNTGAQSKFVESVISELINLQEDFNQLKVRRAIANTQVLSADVGAGLDPTYPEVSEKRNSAIIGNGVQLVKYTGSRGKGGCNDANAEFVGEVRKIFNDNNITWQIGELGKVDQGGGGTIAYILANDGAEVVDCGTPVLGMHSPYELISKADLFMTYKAYKAFMNR
ncbi:MAG: aminopeptidase [Bacillota bacterium]|nr:aminopeptidase [Bacillota bacterium]